MISENETKLGCVETYEHAKICASLFKGHQDEIDGILIVLPNFGEERGVADTIKLSRLQVPILAQAYPDDMDALNVENRRDAFCGKISVCNNLRQYGFPFTLTEQHTVNPKSEDFKADLIKFIGVCQVFKGLHNARLGTIGARPNAFITVPYSEKLLETCGISVSTIDLSEILGFVEKLPDDHNRVQSKLAEIKAYAKHEGVPEQSLIRMAKLGVVISEWMETNDLNASAIQCWPSIQQNYGVNVCTLMSMMSEKLIPSACEVDVTGVISMYALQLASGNPSALVDWNNNYGKDPNRCVFFHCGNWAKSFIPSLEIKTAPILGTTLGEENTYGAMAGRAIAGPITFARVSTDDQNGLIHAYVGEGLSTDEPLEIFGHRAFIEILELQKLLYHICKNGFEHHVAMTMGHVSEVVSGAFITYMGWETHKHL